MDFNNYLLMYNGLTIMGPLARGQYSSRSGQILGDFQGWKRIFFLLREGVKFHHGKELDSGDVKYSMERVMNPATRSPKGLPTDHRFDHCPMTSITSRSG